MKQLQLALLLTILCSYSFSQENRKNKVDISIYHCVIFHAWHYYRTAFEKFTIIYNVRANLGADIMVTE